MGESFWQERRKLVDQPIVSVAGLRGIVGQSFTAEIITPYVAAFADMVAKKRVVVGGDSRASREWAQPVVESVLRARGVDVISIGLAPTPTVGMMVREFAAGGGIAITASHNPGEWNGLKFFQPNGQFLSPRQNEHLAKLIKQPPAPKKALRVGRHEVVSDAVQRHLAKLQKVLGKYAGAGGRRVRIVLDCCNGAGSILAPMVAVEFGAKPEVIFDNPGRPFPRVPEPLPENLRMLCRSVKSTGADFGAALDPDADRLALVDNTGRAIGEERTLLLAADAYLSLTGKKSAIGVNLSTSQAIDALAARYKSKVIRTKIGEAHVLAGMEKARAMIGGEGNGGVILPAVHPGRDAATALALILLGLKHRKGTLADWNAKFPDYIMYKTKVHIGSVPLKKTLARARQMFKEALAVDESDGIKFQFEDSFLHMRPSGTEPILRIFVEAPDKATVKQLLARAQAVLK